MMSICSLFPEYTDVCSSTFKNHGIFPDSSIFPYFLTTIHPEGYEDYIFKLSQYPTRLGLVIRFVLIPNHHHHRDS